MSSETAPQSPAVEQRIIDLPRGSRTVAYVTSVPAALMALGLTSAWLYFWAGDLHRFTQWIAAYESLFVAQFTIYLAACYAVVRLPGRLSHTASVLSVVIVLILAASFRAELVGKRPYLSTDVYRYIWDGRVQAAGINPYRYVPSAAELADLRDENIYPKINRGDYAVTPYPPMAQMIYAAIYWIAPSSVTGFKSAMSMFDLLAMLALVLVLARAGLEPARVVVFAWNPLLIFEAAHSGHIESAFIAFLALGLLAWSCRKPSLAGIALGLATMVKFYPALLLPAFLVANNDANDEKGEDIQWERLTAGLLNRFNLLFCGAFILTIALAYSPYLSVGTGVLGSLGSEFREEGFVEKGGRYFLLALCRRVFPLSTTAFLILAALLLAGIGVWWLLKQKKNEIDVASGALALIGPYLIITSPRYPWHYAWLIPYLCFAPRVGWIYLTGATVLLYLLWYTPLAYPEVPLWLGGAVYIPTMALLVWERWKIRTNGERLDKVAEGSDPR
ncbi:MAG TPA: glycosyltransferase 87 family protein [Blastocatellia bacterium]|jgi:hypothetical protein|nr:glycosyltransferase 87 family protein [Blastocatellia bacterium]